MKKKFAWVKDLIKGVVVFWIDLFAGGGGTTTGIHLAKTGALVVMCVNHDQIAIESHAKNHPNCIHYTEDVRDFDVIKKISKNVEFLRNEYKGCVINIWASLECTNYSKAKGGLPRDEDSRTLANHLIHYIHGINPEYLFIENVREFMAWGPLDENGRPISRMNGIDYLRWVEEIKSEGYDFDWKILNSADYGAYQKRERYFGQFAKKGFPIQWPEATHSKTGSEGNLFYSGMKRWKPVKEILDFHLQSQSIFTRKKELATKTLERIYAGCVKYVAKGDESFLIKYYGNSNAISVDYPCDTLTTKDRFAFAKIVPLSSMVNEDVNFIDNQYGNSLPSAIDQPIGTVTSNPKHNLCQVKHYYLMNPQYNNKGGSIDDPCFTLIARMDKMPPYLVTAVSGEVNIVIYESDPEIMVKIKLFMAEYGIGDIQMRGLTLRELKLIQGFPEDYILAGSQTHQKKQIGNAVHTLVAKAIAETNYKAIFNHYGTN